MFAVNGDTIYANRGDFVLIKLTADMDGANYIFQPGDVVRFTVYGKKDAETVYLQKDFEQDKETEEVEIVLTGKETQFGDVISKPKDYWYEVVLNPDSDPQTILGYDEAGPKVFKLFPEGDAMEAEA